uniref:Uncharacterized protein n=1 Tax=Alexandrium catenella TaxID=2925 RepID=A0A7S1S6K5_ALECA
MLGHPWPACPRPAVLAPTSTVLRHGHFRRHWGHGIDSFVVSEADGGDDEFGLLLADAKQRVTFHIFALKMVVARVVACDHPNFTGGLWLNSREEVEDPHSLKSKGRRCVASPMS